MVRALSRILVVIAVLGSLISVAPPAHASACDNGGLLPNWGTYMCVNGSRRHVDTVFMEAYRYRTRICGYAVIYFNTTPQRYGPRMCGTGKLTWVWAANKTYPRAGWMKGWWVIERYGNTPTVSIYIY
jgi:hypothetical protein